MAMRTIKILVRRWVDERVLKNDDAETASYTALGDFFDWLNEQTDPETVSPMQWGSAMKQLGFPQTKEDARWAVKGIKLND